jgi:hypothetical protein
MSVPDYSRYAYEFLTPRLKRFEGDPEKTRAHSFEQLNALANALRLQFHDALVGLLEKKGGAQVKERAADIIAYDLGNGTCQLVDAISDAEGEDGVPRAAWAEVPDDHQGKRPIAQWKLPYVGDVVEPPEIPPEQPPTTDLEKRVDLLSKAVWELTEKVKEQQTAIEAAQKHADFAHRRIGKLKLTTPSKEEIGSIEPVDTSSRFGHSHQLRAKIE